MDSKDTDIVLNSVKKFLGITEYDFFDADILMHINTVIANLIQMGVGPQDGFRCTESSTWTDITSDNKLLENIKSYIFLKVKLLFDPPSSSVVLASYEKQAAELEWRMYVIKDQERILAEKGG